MSNAELKPDELVSKAYREALNLFLGGDDLRPALMTPFIQEDFAIATNAYSLICFKKSILSVIDFESHPKAPNALAVIPLGANADIDFSTQSMRKEINELNKLAEKTYSITLTKCPDCKGDGFVTYTFEDYKGHDHEIDSSCPTCETETEFEIIINKETGDEIDFFRKVVKIDNALFDAEEFDKVVKVSELLQVSSFKLIQRKNERSAHVFQIGQCTVILMPLHEITEHDLVTSIL